MSAALFAYDERQYPRSITAKTHNHRLFLLRDVLQLRGSILPRLHQVRQTGLCDISFVAHPIAHTDRTWRAAALLFGCSTIAITNSHCLGDIISNNLCCFSKRITILTSAFGHFAASTRTTHHIYGAFVYHGCSFLHCICSIVQIKRFTILLNLGLGLDTSFLSISMGNFFSLRCWCRQSVKVGVCAERHHEELNYYHIDGRFSVIVGAMIM